MIDSEESAQLSRTMTRDNNSEEQVKAIMETQTSRDIRQQHADDIIHNTGTLEELQERVDALHKQYLLMASLHQK